MKISINDIRNMVTGPVFNRGVQYYKSKRVNLTKIELDAFDAEVLGSDLYFVHVVSTNRKLHGSCTCPYWDTCKHVVAALFQAKKYYDEHRADLEKGKSEPRWKSVIEKLLSAEGLMAAKKLPEKNWKIIFTIELSDKCWLLTAQKIYLKKDGSIGRLSSISYFDANTANLQFAPNDPVVINFLQTMPSKYYLYNRPTFGSRNYFYPFDYNSKFLEYGENAGMLIDLLKDSAVFEIEKNQLRRPLTFESQPARVEYQFENAGDDYSLSPYLIWNDQRMAIDELCHVMTSNPVWLLREHRFIKLENCRDAKFLDSLIRGGHKLVIPQKEMPKFINSYLHKLSNFGTFKLPEKFHFQTIDQISGKRIYLTEGDKHLLAQLKVLYDRVEVDVSLPESELFHSNSDSTSVTLIQRNFDAENKLATRLADSGLKENKEGGFKIIDSKALRWIFEQIPDLAKEGFEFYGKEKLTKYKYNTAQPRINFSVNSNIDWFDLNVEIDFDGIELSLKELRKAFQKKTPYVQLVDGSLAVLPEDWFIKFEHLFNFGKVEERKVRLSKYHLTLIDLMLERANRAQTDELFDERLKRLQGFEKIAPKTLPENFVGELREYQKAGYDWLHFLQDFSFGGCLADDMGLGKTVQALALLLNEKNQGTRKPSLIVCPTSVIFNWEKEVQKFAPALTLLNHTGMDRIKDSSAFENYDIILTSYGIVIRDIQFLANYPFHYVILDESQKMKNPLSLTARSVRLLQSDHRLALTGTPIENNTHELWSLFSFLNPGLLGSSNYFKKAFSLQIEKKQNEVIAEQLRRLIFPFILRRTKDQVAKELPPKVEQISYCHMNEEQDRLYHHWRNYYRAMILKQIDEVGLNKSRMRVLEGLTKLRLIACHPQLIEKDIKENSGKFELLQEALEEILSENHKVLVFSQFAKMLTIVRTYLDEQCIAYEYLDGRTRDRERCIQHFQNDENLKIFLISLKAGGIGVNLTAADYVIHYDPWWNPAVEVQATDRTHRIGQDKKVFVYKFITKDTIEEKILQLQERKRNLVSQLITTDSSFFKSITREDIEILFG